MMRCDDKRRKKALALAATAYGVQSVGIEGEEQDQLVVVGDGVDATNLTICLRKKVRVSRADIIKVEAVVADDVKKPADDKTAASSSSSPSPVAEWPPQWCYPYCHRQGVVYPYAGHYYIEDSYPNEGGQLQAT
ncbi:hypothetical protein HU200_032198 [Digitaria exilis]|uniref:Uncharacterized protein n=1 Tax=Digitaria exilis TaxID=1010633 RepID=A0A835EQP0_9POAL|nr:hypothetical protein HU200_032198 [Digitaria exilis]